MDELSYHLKLEVSGHVLRVREPNFHHNRMFRTPEDNIQIYVLSSGSEEVERPLTIREWRRRSPHSRESNERWKREFVARSWSDKKAFAPAKLEVFKGVIKPLRTAGAVLK